MTASPVYQAGPIKRARATKAEVEARREALFDIIEAGRPMTVRGRPPPMQVRKASDRLPGHDVDDRISNGWQ